MCRLLDNYIPPADNELSGIAQPKGTPRLHHEIYFVIGRAITTIFGKVRQSLIGDDNGKLRLPTSYKSERRISLKCQHPSQAIG